MELDKFGNQFAEKERQVEEQRRLYEMEESKLRLKDTELRETSAKLSVYQKLEDTSRLTSMQDDVVPELAKTKELNQKCQDLERKVAIL